jgi:site-specific DNA-methyltransferase (adenine-specific)
MNTLYYGDNLDILKRYIKDETIDLIYLDPPFQSGKNYNIIFQPKMGEIKGATSQITTFEDTWYWGPEAEREYTELITGTLTTEPPSQKLIDLMKAMRGYLAECPLLAYLCMMAPRLLEMKRTLKSTGSIYLHCDPTASHYLKLLMDAVFGLRNFCNEIIWHYKKWPTGKYTFQKNHDTILFYCRSNNKERIFNQLYMERALSTLKRFGTAKIISGHDETGLRKPSKTEGIESEGVRQDDVWDIGRVPPIKQIFPTQKPEKLLERIIKASSNENDLVLDPFCGCGTTIAVAEKTRRAWIGIDVTYLAIDVIKKRLEKNHIKENEHFQVYGVPKDVYSAGQLAEQKPFQFEVWVVSQLNATPTTKTGDKGIDGVINFIDYTKKDKIGKGIISVKGGHSINPGMVRDLKGTIQSQNADFGILITLEKATRGMIEEAVKEDCFDYCYQEGTVVTKIPKIQLLTAEDLFTNPIPVKLPPSVIEPYRKPDIKRESGQQLLKGL